MTYAIEINTAIPPVWFDKARTKARELAVTYGDEFWTRTWNREFKNKITCRGHKFCVNFDSEADYTMFLLRWA